MIHSMKAHNVQHWVSVETEREFDLCFCRVKKGRVERIAWAFSDGVFLVRDILISRLDSHWRKSDLIWCSSPTINFCIMSWSWRSDWS